MTIFRQIHTRVLLLVATALASVGLAAGVAFARSSVPAIGGGIAVIETNLAYQGSQAAGTGIVLTSSGEILTNNHVISGATAIRVVIPGTSRTYAATVLGYSRTDDVALLKLAASNLKTLPLGTSAKLKVGAAVKALGNAGGTGRIVAVRGHVTGLGKSITASDGEGATETLAGLIETDAPIQPGDSGGPLENGAGQVVGMNTAGSTGGGFGYYQSSTATDAYAVPIAKALGIVKQIEAGKSSSTIHVGATGFLGVSVADASSGGYGGYGTATASGALIAGVVPDGPAASAGLVAGDVIVAVDGRTISSASDVGPLVLAKKPGQTISIAYVDQYGQSQTATVTLGTGPAQ